ncbi:type 4 pilus major pilin [Burkholderia sp. BCC0044]|uniref:type 4 pilus major pilin n=1 Tax=Burkholderia sp. BCC0044 TaxID=2676295 RepID=UPI001588C6D1|nr:type 4 pilus major pilin [Burkholderia sp. BCC0044]
MHSNKSVPRHGGQQGFTLVEALVVMIVGIVILAAAAAGIGKLFRSSEIATEAENITQMSANLRNLKNGANGYAGLKNSIAVQYKAVPATMTVSTTTQGDETTSTIKNTWNGEVEIKAHGDSNQTYSIKYGDVPPEACQQLVLKLRNAGWSSLTAGSAEITSATSLSAIGDACKADKNILTFVSTS